MNILSALLGTVAVTVLGMIWYNPRVFGLRWAQGVGLAQEFKDTMKPTSPLTYVGMLVGAIFWSSALGFLLMKTNPQNLGDVHTFGLIAWAGITMPLVANARWWEVRPWSVVAINGAYQLICTMTIVTIHHFVG